MSPRAPPPARAVLYEARDSGGGRPHPEPAGTDERLGWGTGGGFWRPGPGRGDPRCRAIVLTGKGRAFCAGADMGDLNSIGSATVQSAGDADLSRDGRRTARLIPHHVDQAGHRRHQRCLRRHRLTQALMCDVRFAAAGPSSPPPSPGAGSSPNTASPGSCRVIGWGAALDLLLSGRVFLAGGGRRTRHGQGGRRPRRPLPRHRLRRGHRVANCAPSSLAVIKRQVYSDATARARRRQRPCRDADARVDAPPGFIEGHHRLLREAPPNFPAQT